MRYLQLTLTGLCIVLVASVAIAQDQKAEKPMDPQAMMDVYAKLATPGEPHKLFASLAGSWTTRVGGRLDMPKLRFTISMSLDGFGAGPSQSVENPLGIGGMRLHQWAFPLAVWRSTHGLQGGEGNRVVEESLANIGATVMGRNMFGGHPGP